MKDSCMVQRSINRAACHYMLHIYNKYIIYSISVCGNATPVAVVVSIDALG